MKRLTPTTRLALVFFVAGLIWRLIFWPTSQGAYTDGILQIDMFRQGLSYWPPLMALLARLLVWVPGLDLEGAGRMAALIMGAATVFPVAAIARRLFGRRAALWAMAAWLASPLALRWSLQPMSDMPMTALAMASLAAMLIALEHALPGRFAQGDRVPEPDLPLAGRWLLLASMAAALATLTRYQGILLVPLLALVAAVLQRRGGLPAKPALLLALPWLAIPAWVLRGGVGSLLLHFEQIGERGSQLGLLETLIGVYWYLFEEFLLKLPYFITYGLTAFAVFGLFRTRWATDRIRWFGYVTLYLTLALLVLQSVFSSYQSRYLLPLVPLACLWAGHGLAAWERRAEGHRVRFWALTGPTLAYGAIFAALVAVFQGSPFLDMKKAAAFVREYDPAAERRILANEVYNEHIQGAKLYFWLGGRDVLPMRQTPPQPGDLIILSSFYEGGPGNYQSTLDRLAEVFPVKVLERFPYRAYPLLPDIMEEPITHQNPLAWQLRYRPQFFQTAVIELQEPVSVELPEDPIDEEAAARALRRRQAEREERLRRLRAIEQTIDDSTTPPAAP